MDESNPKFAGLYNGIGSYPVEVKSRAESHDVVLHLGPFPVSANTGGFSSQLAPDRVIELHADYCSAGGKVWKGLDFRPVIAKLLQRLVDKPLQRKGASPQILTKPTVCILLFANKTALLLSEANHLVSKLGG